MERTRNAAKCLVMFLTTAARIDMNGNPESVANSLSQIDNALVNAIEPAATSARELRDVEIFSVDRHKGSLQSKEKSGKVEIPSRAVRES